MKYYKPEKIWIEESSLGDRFTGEVLSRLPHVPREIIQDTEGLIRSSGRKPNALTWGKRNLLIMRKKGESFKPFPLIPEYLSCHFQILHLGSGCDLECTYCILQAYLNNPFITIYSNFEEILRHLAEALDSRKDQFFRVGTGELIDSLSLDHLTEWSVRLVELFAARQNGLLEFKTKSDNVANLERVDPKGKVVVSWSVNTETIQRREEFKTATLTERIAAARRCQSWGYRVGFHFDPLIVHDGWEEGYAKTVAAVFSAVDPARVAWVSFGALRFMPALKEVAEERFPKTRLFSAEFVRGLDGKSRYFKPLRKQMYSALYRLVRDHAPRVPVYLCMESPGVWKSGLDVELTSSQELKAYLDGAAQDACQLPSSPLV